MEFITELIWSTESAKCLKKQNGEKSEWIEIYDNWTLKSSVKGS